MQVLPIPKGAAFFQQRTQFEGTDYLLDFAWNERASAWFVSFLTLEGEPIVSGLKVLCNVPLFRRRRYRPLPPGELMAVDTTRKVDLPGYDQLGTDIPLVYYSEAEIQAIHDAING